MSHLRVSPQQLLFLGTWASSESVQSLLATAEGRFSDCCWHLNRSIDTNTDILRAFWQTCNVNFTKARKIFPTRAYHLSNHRILSGFAVKDVDSILRSRLNVQKAIAPPPHHNSNAIITPGVWHTDLAWKAAHRVYSWIILFMTMVSSSLHSTFWCLIIQPLGRSFWQRPSLILYILQTEYGVFRVFPSSSGGPPNSNGNRLGQL